LAKCELPYDTQNAVGSAIAAWNYFGAAVLVLAIFLGITSSDGSPSDCLPSETIADHANSAGRPSNAPSLS
jgi:hypothetical protein